MRSRSATMTSSAATLVTLTVALAILAPTGVVAHENGLYASIKLGTTDVDTSFGDAFDNAINGDDRSKAYEVGFRWSPHWALQGGYHDFGTAPGLGTGCGDVAAQCTPPEVALESTNKAYSLAIVPQLPLGKRLSAFVKIGVVKLDGEIRDADGAQDLFDSFSQEDVIWGAGLRSGLLGPIQLFYEYEGIGDDFRTQSFGATWQF